MYGVVNFRKDKIFEVKANDEKEALSYRFQGNTYTIIYSGHIYNKKELRDILIRKNFEIEKNFDTEILLKLYIVLGKDFINHLNGAYSFAIWSEKEKELFAVRDRFGLEPFYYAMRNGNFIFASSIKEILKHPDVKTQIDSKRYKRIDWNRASSFTWNDTF